MKNFIFEFKSFLILTIVIQCSLMVNASHSLKTLAPQDGISPDSYLFESILHRKLVLNSGLAIFREYSEDFNHLNENIIETYLRLHDLPKIMSVKNLKKWDESIEETFYNRFAPFFGISLNELNETPYQKFLLSKTISDLNRMEGQIKSKFLSRLSEVERIELENLEELADFLVSQYSRQHEIPGYDAYSYWAKRERFDLLILAERVWNPVFRTVFQTFSELVKVSFSETSGCSILF